MKLLAVVLGYCAGVATAIGAVKHDALVSVVGLMLAAVAGVVSGLA